MCCVDDLPKAPYNLKYNGWKPTGSDTAYLFELVVTKVDAQFPDFDGPEPGNCTRMSLYDLGISICEWSGLGSRGGAGPMGDGNLSCTARVASTSRP